ncbi:MAG TPA: DUF6457 domain-containing protein [Gaiellaceae bacterium]
MDAWLAQVTEAIGLDPDTLSDADEAELLDLARIAAHESGERTNAPLLCYLLGLAAARGTSLAELARTVRRSTS